ncbi:L-amino acid N-acyltransferase YncA [Pseudomonas cuatrocienegasensis]|uniref:L-amino acid N-acyltransferase YncA n=1 Tax=Pseudomonas cuatrocienegasensis TaxID=543360 RepID=A0ABY1BEI4_9PSED|nr:MULTISPECIES: GNAT family N-acetyltransferase [Pseudomonas]OEC34756.1 GNAT family acetyltransferase [Pseudomonas sp. 21C1]SEQ65836.1 L-amino acid N-acyltransferase YncA [Pseudomonas cuatrocienegasensis]
MPTTFPNLSTRPAEAADLAEVVGFVQNADELFYAYPKASWPLGIGQLAAAMAERRDSTVVCLDDRVAGFANFYQWQHGDYCALGNIMVAPWARGKGVAQHLIEAMETLARLHYKAREMRVSCFSANSAGLLLYSRLGYQLSGLVERQDHRQQRVALMQFSKQL